MRNIDEPGVSENTEGGEKRWEAGLLALCIAVAALLFAYNRQPLSFASWIVPSGEVILRSHEEYLLLNCCLLLLPLMILLSVGKSPEVYGMSRSTRWGWGAAAVCYILMLPLLWWASGQPDFQHTYPLYRLARRSLPALLYHELTYMFYLWCWELFFRGVLTSICWRWLGWVGLTLQALIFALLHVGKPVPEVFGSFIAGMVLAVIAVRARSFIPAFVCHALVSASMDILVLWRTGAW